MSGGEVNLIDLTKRFGEVTAVDSINVRVEGGEFFSLLGPSGCGKTTTLRMVAGFELPTAGEIVLDGVDVARIPPDRRRVNTVFQSYALFPHLRVFDNVAFGLRRAGVDKGEVRRRVAEALELVELTGLERRKPSQLSGGQQQRVALARVLVLRPPVVLLDEPLGALDAKIRRSLQVELKALQEQVGLTFIYVTHDQEEALTMSDRLAVMNRGQIEQVGSPKAVYEEPETVFVADFLGLSNLLRGVSGALEDGHRVVEVAHLSLRVPEADTDRPGGEIRLFIRPERVRLKQDGPTAANQLPAIVERVVYRGATSQVFVRLPDGQPLQALVQNADDAELYDTGAAVTVQLPPNALRLLGETGSPPAAQPPPTGTREEAGAAITH